MSRPIGYDATEEIGQSLLKNNLNKNMTVTNWHNVRTIFYWGVVFIIGGVGALKGSIPGDVTSFLAIMGILEHSLAGNVDSPTQ